MKKQIIIILATVAVIVAAGATFVAFRQNSADGENKTTQNEEQESVVKDDEKTDWVELNDEEYATLIKGGLSKELVEEMLAIGPNNLEEGMIDQKAQGEDFSPLENMLTTVGDTSVLEIAGISKQASFEVEDWKGESAYTTRTSLGDMNNLFSFYKDDAFSEYEGAKVQDGMLYINAASPAWHGKVTILNAKQNGKEMVMEYEKTMIRYDGKKKFYRCKAYLIKQEDGLFQVSKIETDKNLDILFQEKLDEVKAGNYPSEDLIMNEGDQVDAGNNSEFGKYMYAYHDINGDGVDDLLISLYLPYSRLIAYVSTEDGGIALVYDPENHKEKVFYYGATLTGGVRTVLTVLNDGTGLLDDSWSSGTGDERADCITIDGDGDSHTEVIFANVFMDDAPRELLPPSKEIEWVDL